MKGFTLKTFFFKTFKILLYIYITTSNTFEKSTRNRMILIYLLITHIFLFQGSLNFSPVSVILKFYYIVSMCLQLYGTFWSETYVFYYFREFFCSYLLSTASPSLAPSLLLKVHWRGCLYSCQSDLVFYLIFFIDYLIKTQVFWTAWIWILFQLPTKCVT